MRSKVLRAARLGLAVCVAAWIGGRPARADFLFDPDGGGPQGSLTITGFLPAANSSFANGGMTAIRNVLAAGGTGADIAADQFIFTYQTNLTGFLPSNQVDPGLNLTHQITATLQMREFVSSVSANFRTFTFAASSNQTGMAGLQMWANNGPPTFDGTGLNGTQYKPATATLILTAGTASSITSNFTNALGSPVFLDQAPNAIGWGNQQSVAGSGGSIVNFQTTFANQAYFPSGLTGVSQLTFNFSQSLPFQAINPAQTMWDGTSTQPLIGGVNGDVSSNGSSALFQVNGTLAATAVPEPSTITLAFVGVVGLVGGRAARRCRRGSASGPIGCPRTHS
jgi:hypothetical protein